MVNEAPPTLAIIPARAGSERIPRKNLLSIAGLPLVAHTIRHAREAQAVDQVVVSTDDPHIAALAASERAEVVRRPPELAGSNATSESALLHALDHRRDDGHEDPELVVFLQATSPVRRHDDIDRAVATLLESEADSLFSATRSRWLIWAEREGSPVPLNYNLGDRRREQEMGVQWRENGSIFVTRTDLLRRESNRLGGRIAVYEMDYWCSFQLDAPEDAELLEWILSRPEYRSPVAWPDRIDLVVFDFDGVMTDNRVLVTTSGDEGVLCSRADGWGIESLQAAGIPALIVSAEPNPVVAARAKKVGIPHHHGVADKARRLREVIAEMGIEAAHVAFVGNDVNDLDCLELVGLPVVVADADASARAAAKLVLSRPGGQGAVREFCEMLLAHVGLDVPRTR